MQTSEVAPWVNLQAYFKSALLGSNFLVLGITLALALLLNAFTFSGYVYLIFYAIIGYLLCNQFVAIYFDLISIKKKAPSLSHIFLHHHNVVVFQLFAFCCGITYLFDRLENVSYFFSLLYNLCFIVFAPAMISCLLTKKNIIAAFNPFYIIAFIFKNILLYFFYITILLLMGLGYKTIGYYAMLWLKPEYSLVLNVALLAYLFLVSAYILSDSNNLKVSMLTDKDIQELSYLKKHLSSGNYDEIHIFFHPSKLHTRSTHLLDFYLKFILSTQDESRIDIFGNFRIMILFQQNEVKKALSLYENIFAKTPQFNLTEPMFSYILAKNLMLTKQFKTVIHLLNDLPRKNPKFRNLPEVLLLLAKAYIELNLEVNALQALEEIIKNHPHSKYCPEAIALKNILEINSSDLNLPKL